MYPSSLSWAFLALGSLWASAGAAKTASPEKYSFGELWDLQNSLWENFLYPRNLKQINATDESVFTSDVSCGIPHILRHRTLTPPGQRSRRRNPNL